MPGARFEIADLSGMQGGTHPGVIFVPAQHVPDQERELMGRGDSSHVLTTPSSDVREESTQRPGTRAATPAASTVLATRLAKVTGFTTGKITYRVCGIKLGMRYAHAYHAQSLEPPRHCRRFCRNFRVAGAWRRIDGDGFGGIAEDDRVQGQPL
jgi:hypothetical protein